MCQSAENANNWWCQSTHSPLKGFVWLLHRCRHLSCWHGVKLRQTNEPATLRELCVPSENRETNCSNITYSFTPWNTRHANEKVSQLKYRETSLARDKSWWLIKLLKFSFSDVIKVYRINNRTWHDMLFLACFHNYLGGKSKAFNSVLSSRLGTGLPEERNC